MRRTDKARRDRNLAAQRRNPYESTVALLKKQVTHELDSGNREVVLDISGLPLREFQRVRMHANRWLRTHGWRGQTRLDRDRNTLTVRVLQEIEVADTEAG